jgi:hypothetical protein
MKMKKQDKEKKVGKAKKGKEHPEEKRRVVEKSSAAGSRVAAAGTSGPLMPKVEGKLAARTQPGQRSVVPVKPAEEKAAKKPDAPKETAAKKVPASGRTGAAAHPEAASKESLSFGPNKEYSASRRLCKVTFRLPAAAAPAAKKVTIVGDFNGWDKETTSLKRQDNGDFAVTLDLDAGREYRFRYLIDGKRWENDWRADRYVRSPYGVDDSVVSV